jgi:imidazolonepropionase-like amidohydrolase
MMKVLKAALLIDGTGAPPVERSALVVEGAKIVGVFRGEPPDSLVPADAETLDFPGCTIMPGLIDAHVHLNLPGDGTLLEDVVKEPDGVLVATSTFWAARALAAGITTLRDLGGARSTVFHLRRALELGHGHGSRILACGQPITVTGGHTWYFGGEADGEAGLRLKVREMAKLGADFIKVMASGGGTVNTMSWLSSFSPAELAAIVDESHRLGRKVTAHCLCAQSIEDAVDAGVDQIEHAGFIVDRDGNQKFVPAVGDKLAKSGIPVTGTLAVGGSAIRAMRAKDHRSPAEEAFLERWKRMFADNMLQFNKLREAGVRFVAGTDGGWRFTPVDGLPLEIELMHQGGLTAMEALVAATGFAAKVLGVDDTLGTLTAGLAADVIVIPGNPLDDLGTLNAPRWVMQGGVVRSTDGRAVADRRG